MSAQQQTTVLERPEPKYFARIPKLAIMDKGLDPYELALYCNFKQTASEHGTAFKSNKTLAKECKMSPRKVSSARKSLEEKGLIKLEYIRDENGVINQTVRVTIVDIWEENIKRYTPSEKVIPMQVVHTPHAQDAYPHAQDATKEEPIKKNQDKKIPATQTDRDRLFDGIALLAFGLDAKSDSPDVKTLLKKSGGRIGKVKKFLTELEEPCTPEELFKFSKWYKHKYPDADLPRDDTKFAEHFIQFRVGVTQPNTNTVSYHKTAVVDESQPMSDAEAAEFAAQTKAVMDKIRTRKEKSA